MCIHLQGVDVSSLFHRGKAAEAEAVDRSFGEKRYDPLQATPPPPPLPTQYSQGAHPNPNTALGLQAHTKGPHGEGRWLRSGQTAVTVRLSRLQLASYFLSKNGYCKTDILETYGLRTVKVKDFVKSTSFS